MKGVIVLLCLTVAPSLGLAKGAAEKAKSPSKLENAIRNLELRRFKAMVDGDVETLELLLAPDMSYSHANGWTQTKKEFIDAIRRGELKYEEMKADALQVRVYGASAVVTGRASVKANTKGQGQALVLRFLDVYVKRRGRWQMVAWQSARLAQ